MESKGRRSLRAAEPSATPAEVAVPGEAPTEAAKPVESQPEEPKSAEAPAEIVVPAAILGEGALAAPATSPSSDDFAEFGRQAFAALVQSQTALARGVEALTAEMAGLALSGIDVASRTATDMLAVKTLSDAIELNAGLTRSSFDALFGGSTKLSELGVKVVADASQPILTQLGKSWTKAVRLAFRPA